MCLHYQPHHRMVGVHLAKFPVLARQHALSADMLLYLLHETGLVFVTQLLVEARSGLTTRSHRSTLFHNLSTLTRHNKP